MSGDTSNTQNQPPAQRVHLRRPVSVSSAGWTSFPTQLLLKEALRSPWHCPPLPKQGKVGELGDWRARFDVGFILDCLDQVNKVCFFICRPHSCIDSYSKLCVHALVMCLLLPARSLSTSPNLDISCRTSDPVHIFHCFAYMYIYRVLITIYSSCLL